MKRSKSFQYKGVILVAHSLGAVVCRLALLAANARNDGWASKVRMVLFAPAHCGTKSIGWISSAVTGLNLPPLNLALTILRSRFKVADDLMFDSPVIEQLRKDTEQAFERGSVDYLRAAKVVWAQNDDVVINGRFVRDPAPDSFEKSHRAVCKPSYDYLNPVEQVIEILLQ